MKNIIILIFCAVTFYGTAQETTQIDSTETTATTYYLIRHAEKDRSDSSNRNPELNRKGDFRAESWAKVFDKVALDAVYSTNYSRTLLTAAPTARAKELELTLYNPQELYSEKFQKETEGKTVLVVGHSNTTPDFVNAILGEKRFPHMSDSDNSSMYVVTIMGDKKHVEVLTIN